MRESSIEKSIVKWAKLRGIESVKMDCKSSIGLPDRMFFLHGGRPLFIEIKRPGGKVSDIQRFTIDRLKRKGYDVVVCDSKDDAIFHLQRRMGAAQVPE